MSGSLKLEAFVLHQSDKNQDGQWHSLGTLIDPAVWAQQAANIYGRPVLLKSSRGTEVYIPKVVVEACPASGS